MSKPRILFSGCWGYGSVGDDLYRELWPQLLPECECLMDRFGNLGEWGQVDAVIIGGGGVINSISLGHEKRILGVVDFAMRRSLPLAFASVGCMPVTENHTAELSRWWQALEYASIITARSPADVRLINSVAPRANAVYAPDLGYLVKPALGRLIPPGKTVIVPYCGKDWSPGLALRNRPKGSILLALNKDDIPLCRELGGEVMHSFSPSECCAVLRDAAEVWTARYHGLILARAAGQSRILVPRSTWKLDNEPSAWTTESALLSVDMVRKSQGDLT